MIIFHSHRNTCHQTPTERILISNSNSITNNLGHICVDWLIKLTNHLYTNHPIKLIYKTNTYYNIYEFFVSIGDLTRLYRGWESEKQRRPRLVLEWKKTCLWTMIRLSKSSTSPRNMTHSWRFTTLTAIIRYGNVYVDAKRWLNQFIWFDSEILHWINSLSLKRVTTTKDQGKTILFQVGL